MGTDIRGAMLIKHQEWEWGGVTVTKDSTPTNKKSSRLGQLNDF